MFLYPTYAKILNEGFWVQQAIFQPESSELCLLIRTLSTTVPHGLQRLLPTGVTPFAVAVRGASWQFSLLVP